MPCHYCGTSSREMRPYGPGGTDVCHPCATTPEREAATKAAFYAQLEAAEAVSPVGTAVIGDRVGAPQPYIPSDLSELDNRLPGPGL